MEYRLKTVEEFLETYGEYWRDKVPCHWAKDMLPYCGQTLKEEESKEILKWGKARLERFGGWMYHKDTLVPIESPEEEVSEEVLCRETILKKEEVKLEVPKIGILKSQKPFNFPF